MAKKNEATQEVQNETTAEQVTEIVQQPAFDANKFIIDCGSVSAAIRKLHADGKSRGEIAKLLNKRYQHVRNVLITPVKKAG